MCWWLSLHTVAISDPITTGLPSNRYPGLGCFSRADWGIGGNFQAILPLIFFAFRIKVSEPLLTVCPSHSPGDGLSGCWYLEVPTQRSLPSGSVQITDNTADTGDFPLGRLCVTP